MEKAIENLCVELNHMLMHFVAPKQPDEASENIAREIVEKLAKTQLCIDAENKVPTLTNDTILLTLASILTDLPNYDFLVIGKQAASTVTR